MSDSIDRVFVHALATVRRLPRTGSSRPPPAARLKLYGLYKQSMEGDVNAILPRPELPPASPDPGTPVEGVSGQRNGNGTTSVHRYAARDLRTREAQAEIEKWDSWNVCSGLSRTEAKRRYISTLIDTMKEYASGTSESRELVGELEFVWEQVRNQSGSDPDEGSGADKDSPGRKRERAGLGRNESFQTAIADMDVPALDEGRGRRHPRRTASGLRVLSPVDQSDEGEPGEVVAESESPARESPSVPRTSQFLPSTAAHNIDVRRSDSTPSDPAIQSLAQWQRSLERQIHHLTTEIAALREQLSANHLLSSSTYSHTYYALSKRGRILHRLSLHVKRIGAWLTLQLQAQAILLVFLIIYGRFTDDLRIEQWLRIQLGKFRRKCGSLLSNIGGFLLDLLSRDGWMNWLRGLLRWTRLVSA